jgi:hypothetical protein
MPTHITDGIRKLPKPQVISVCIPPGWKKTALFVLDSNGKSEVYPISKKVAEVLIANGITYQG